jgi:coenzyme F420-reducing hydrogenase gamma subunit
MVVAEVVEMDVAVAGGSNNNSDMQPVVADIATTVADIVVAVPAAAVHTALGTVVALTGVKDMSTCWRERTPKDTAKSVVPVALKSD